MNKIKQEEMKNGVKKQEQIMSGAQEETVVIKIGKIMITHQGIQENRGNKEMKVVIVQKELVLNVVMLDICRESVRTIKGKRMLVLNVDKKDIWLKIAPNLIHNKGQIE